MPTTAIKTASSPFSFGKSLGPHKYGCLLLDVPDGPLRKAIAEWTAANVRGEHLAPEGREPDFHVTVKYGFKDSSSYTPDALGNLLRQFEQITIKLVGLSLFTGGDDGDVLKIDVEGPELRRLNAIISERFPCEDSHPEYKPHLTLAYLKPEFSDLYADASPPFIGESITFTRAEWKSVDGEGESLPLGPSMKTMSASNELAGGALVAPPAWMGPKPRRWLPGKSARFGKRIKSGESYFGSCERDQSGHCLPKGEHGTGGKKPLAAVKLAREKEASIANESEEHGFAIADDGTILASFRGGTEINLSKEEEAKCKDATVTHNHPGSTSLSVGDFFQASRLDVASIRAVVMRNGKPETHVIVRPENGWPSWDEINKVEHDVNMEALAQTDEMNAAGKFPSKKDARIFLSDAMAKILSERLGIDYNVQKIADSLEGEAKPPKMPPSPFTKSLPFYSVKSDSYFGNCERDDSGHCLPSGQGEVGPGLSGLSATEKPGRIASGGIAALRASRDAARRIGEAEWDKIPPARQKLYSQLARAAKWVEHKASTAMRRGQHVAREVARARGLSEANVERVGRWLAVADNVSAWTVNFPAVTALTGNPLAGKASSFLPLASAAYVAYSGLRNPFKTILAASKAVAEKMPDDGHKGMEGQEEIVVRLLELVNGANDPEWADAVVSAALDACGHDLAKAERLAAKVLKGSGEGHAEAKMMPSPFASVKAMEPPKMGESYFASCERDKEGHCLPKGESEGKPLDDVSTNVYTTPGDEPVIPEGGKMDTATTTKKPWELTRDEYMGVYKDAKTDAEREALRAAGFIGNWKRQLEQALARGENVPQSIIDKDANSIEFVAKKKLKAELGEDYLQKIRDKAAKPIHEVVRTNVNGSVTVRQRQTGPKTFYSHEKGDIVSEGDDPKIVAKAKKPYVGKHDGEITGYFQDLVLRDPKKGEVETAKQAVAAAKAVVQHDSQLGNEDYPDLKKEQMAEHEKLARLALGANDG